jgi:hypothetical protein
LVYDIILGFVLDINLGLGKQYKSMFWYMI